MKNNRFTRRFLRLATTGLAVFAAGAFISASAFGAVITNSVCEDKTQVGGVKNISSFGYALISQSTLYVIYSGAIKSDSSGRTSYTTSNIYVIKGTPSAGKTRIWVFGMGYGDPADPAIPGDLSDVEIYRNSTTKPARNATVDACYLDLVIQKEFGVAPNLADIRFVTPHYHLDHINQEFISALPTINSYQLTYSKFYAHVRDSLAISVECNSKCCGKVGTDGQCNSGTTDYWAAPFKSVWDANTVSALIRLGSEADLPCAKVTKGNQIDSFQSALGTWTISVGTADHTRGPLYLSLPISTDGKRYLIKGADSQNGVVDSCEAIILPTVPDVVNVVLNMHEVQPGF